MEKMSGEAKIYPASFYLWILVITGLVFQIRRRVLANQSAGFAAP